MKKRILIACDLEGVNNVVGEPYTGLIKGCEQWAVAKHQAALEINAVAEALFDLGADCVDLWDIPAYRLTYPALMEKSCKRVEDAAKYLAKLLAVEFEAEYLSDEILGKDAHTVQSTVYRIEDFIKCI